LRRFSSKPPKTEEAPKVINPEDVTVYEKFQDGSFFYDNQECFEKVIGKDFTPSTGNGSHPETFRRGYYEYPERKRFGKMTPAEKAESLKKKKVDINSHTISENYLPDFKYDFSKVMTYQYPTSKPEPKGRIFFLHGYGDYVGRYGYWLRHFAENGYDVVGMDYPSFGKSEGHPRWVWGSPYDGINAYIKFINQVNSQKGQLPTYLMGYSLGTISSFHIANSLREKIDGMVMLCPYVDLPANYKKFLAAEGAINKLSGMAPAYKLVSGQDRLPTVYEYFHRDELKTQSMTMNMLTNVFAL
jgi:hypothetical protein